ncbi:MAG: sigma-70 family RNA polymerase sigma factor [Planctomycetota bacterium]|nr:sigma-70 family RNA polymerase sigma factor [Planctomycetota bacterium]
MHDPRLSALFERYRSQSDLTALAKLFDEISPEMMRVARHVAGRGVDPEDVVQSTFLASIERADAFDASRPIVPWLMGILINQARLMNRRRATRHEEAAAEDLPSGAHEPDDAEAHEVRDAVTRALAELPPTYREVLVAHLAEGKPPHEIARDLGRPQGTVRAQLHRGLRIVRRSLPAGFAFGAAALLDRSALASVRREVLESAARAQSLPVAAIPAASSTSNVALGVAAASAVLAAIVGIAWMAGRSGRAGGDLELAVAAPAGPGSAAGLNEPPAGSRIAAAAPGSSVPAASAPEPAAVSTAQGSVRVTVRDALGAPVPGIHVDMLAWGDPLWHERVRGLVTDRDGIAEFPRVHAGRIGVHLDGGGAQSRADVKSGERTDVAIQLERGLDLTGIVVDERGLPVEGAIVEAGEDPAREPRRASAATGPDGRFVLGDVERALVVWARGAGRPSSEAVWFGTPTWSRKAAADVRLVLPDLVAPLEFAVVDSRGQPIAGALAVELASEPGGDALAAFRPDGALVVAGRAVRARSGADGLVRLALDRTRTSRVAISARGYAPRELDLEDVGSLVALGPGARLVGVARYSDGVAAEESLVEAQVEGYRDPFRARAGPDGSWRIDDVPPGPLSLRAQASRDAAPSEYRGLAIAGEAVTWNPVLEHASLIRGIARSVHGGVAKTWLVKAVRESTGNEARDASILPAWTLSRASAWRGQDLRQCWTGEDGTFAVPCSAGATYRLELRARAAWNGAVLGALDGIAAGARDVDLRVQSERGFVRGRFVDAAGRPVVATLSAVRRASGAEHRVDAQPDGRFERDLHPGTYTLVVWPADGAPRSLGARDIGADEAVDLGDVRLDATGSLTVRRSGISTGEPISLRGVEGLLYQLSRSGADLVATGLPAGDYVVVGRRADGRSVEVPVHVEVGTRTTIGLD